MELSDILSSLRRRWRIGVGMILLTLAVLAAFYVTRQEVLPTPRYAASAELLVPARDIKDGSFPVDVPKTLFFGQAALATSKAVHDQAIANAQVPAGDLGPTDFGFSQNGAGDIVTLRVSADSPTGATNVVKGWADAYLNARAAQAANGAKDAQDRAYRTVQVQSARLDQIEEQVRAIDPNLLSIAPGTTTGTGPPSLNVPANVPIDTALLVYERASVIGRIESARQEYVTDKAQAESPSKYGSVVEIPPVANITPPASSPQTPTYLILGVGLVLALLIPVLVDRMDHTIRDAKTAAAAFSAPVLSSIPAASRLRQNEIAKAGTAREGAFRALAATSVATDRLPRSIVVTSPLGEEQDSVAANFAAALAGLGVRVALVGTSPRQAWFSQDSLIASPGSKTTTFPQLLDLAYAGRLNGEAPRYLVRSSVDNLFVLPPGEIDIEVSTDGLAPLLHALASANIDVTVLAAPAILKDPNTTIYAWTTRSVMWVMGTGEITVEQAREAANRIAMAGVTPFGVAMVDQES